MDLYCPKCGEPWDFDSLHDEAQARYGVSYYVEDDPYIFPTSRTKNPDYDADAYQRIFREVQREFQSKGCETLYEAYGAKCGSPSSETGPLGLTRQAAASALYELLGDDMDGAAAMLEDEFGW